MFLSCFGKKKIRYSCRFSKILSVLFLDVSDFCSGVVRYLRRGYLLQGVCNYVTEHPTSQRVFCALSHMLYQYRMQKNGNDKAETE
jgi:hypothetical protein